jgi:two-component system sensor histidine kinase KdpD
MTTGAAEQLAIEADRGRAALLAAVSHDLRAPLAAAKAAVSGLRSGDARLTAEDREELLATAEESLDLLAHLAASLLDVSRLQAGALAVFPRPADLGEIVADSLGALGPQARTVLADIPSALRQVMADPAIMERVIANLVGNAVRYSPAASPPLVTARDLGDRVELCVVDHGTGSAKPTGSACSCPSSASATRATGPVSGSASWCPAAWRRRWAAPWNRRRPPAAG